MNQEQAQKTDEIDQLGAETWVKNAIANGSTTIKNEQGLEIELRCENGEFTCNGQTYTQEEITEALKDPAVLFEQAANNNNSETSTPENPVEQTQQANEQNETTINNSQEDNTEIQAANVDNEAATVEEAPAEETDKPVQATSESDDKSEQGTTEKQSRQERREARQTERSEKKQARIAARQERQKARAAEKSEPEMQRDDEIDKNKASFLSGENSAENLIETAIQKGTAVLKIDSKRGVEYIVVKYDQATNKFTYNDQSYTQDDLQEVLQNDLSFDNLTSGTNTIDNTQQTIESDANTVEQIARNSDGTPGEGIVDEAQKTISENETSIEEVAENNENNPSENISQEVDSIAESSEQAAQEAEEAAAATEVTETVPTPQTTETDTVIAEENSELAAAEEIISELDENSEAAGLEQSEAEIAAAASQNPQETVSDNQNPEESDRLEKPEGAQEILDKEMKRALTPKQGEIKTPELEKTDAQIKFERQQKMDKAIEIGSTILEAGSQGLQAYSAIQNLTSQPDPEAEGSVLKLSNMKKGRSLIRKIKKRRAALYGYATK